MRFVRIPPGLLRSLNDINASNLARGDLYYHHNPFVRGIFWKRLERIFGFCRAVPAERVLDLGCGGGELLPSLSRLYPRVWGMDLKTGNARKVVDHYRLENVTLIEGDFLRQGFDPGMFDLVVAADVWEHQRDLEAFFRQLLRVLRPGGTVIGSIPLENALYRLGRRVFRITPPEDHYQRPELVMATADRYFQKEKTAAVPFNFFPLFKVIKYIINK